LHLYFFVLEILKTDKTSGLAGAARNLIQTRSQINIQ
jgi:hypothetical protein